MPNNVRIGVGVPGAKASASELDKLRDRFAALQKQGAKGFAIGAGAAVTAKALNLVGEAAGGAVQFLEGAIESASALNESLGKSQVVFGESAKDIERWAETGAKGFGASKQAALEAAGTYGNLLEAFGIAQPKAASMSKQLVQLAADLASFNNTSVQDAIEALRSGLSGETEPLKRYGVALSDARMRQELMAQGVKDLGATLTPLQKTTAAYALILKDTKNAQGDFARTSGGLANQQRIAAAELENVKAKLGTEFLPVQLAVTKATVDFTESVGEAVDGLHVLDQTVTDATGGMAGLGDVIGGVVKALQPGGGALDATKQRLKDMAAEAQAAADRADYMASHVKDDMVTVVRPTDRAADAISDVGSAASYASGTGSDLAGALDRIAEAAGHADESLRTLEDDLFGAQQRSGDLAQAQDDLAALLKKPPKEGTREWTIWNGKVAEAKQRVFDLEYQQAQAKGPKALYDWLNKQAGQLKKNTKEWYDLNTLIAQTALLLGKLPADVVTLRTVGNRRLPTELGRHLAEGGIVKAKPGGTLAVIGEAGQDEAVIPIGKGPTAGRLVASTGGSSTTININVSTPLMTPGSAEALARQIGPYLTRYQQKRGLVAAGRV